MSSWSAWVLSCALGVVAAGCAGDDGGGGGTAGQSTGGSANTGGSATGGSSSGGSSSGDRCQRGCVETIKAHCTLSPKDQATCESDCHEFESGTCGAKYRAFQDCAEGKPITCDPIAGFPVVAGCEAQQNAFIDCPG